MRKIKLPSCKIFLQLAITVAIALSTGTSSYATTANDKGIVQDANGFRWEYNLETVTEDEQDPATTLYFSFYDKPAAATTVTVPTLSEMLSLVPNAPANLDTYILVDADTDAQNTAYSASYPRREATAATNKLDMSGTSKIQIMGVVPIIDPTVETELVFGENMVIGDGKTSKAIKATVCKSMSYSSYYDTYYCGSQEDVITDIPNYRQLTPSQIENYVPTLNDINCVLSQGVNAASYNANNCYVKSNPELVDTIIGTFSYYRLKLTNFNSSNFNYVGWKAFANSTISNQEITISGNNFMGGDIFAGTNIKRAIINTENIGPGIFRNTKQLESVTFGDSVTKVTEAAFAGSGLTSFDFSQTHITTIGPTAFDGSMLSSINLEGVNRLEYRAFKDTLLTEIYLPKSINYLEAHIFYGCDRVKKLTVAYDTLTSGTTLPMFVVLDGMPNNGRNHPTDTIEEIEVIAPYGENEQVSNTHVLYNDYKFRYDNYTHEYLPQCDYVPSNCANNYAANNDFGFDDNTPYNDYFSSGSHDGFTSLGYFHELEDDYADVDSKKNVIAPVYFANIRNIKKITIGEGYEFVGSLAFFDWSDGFSSEKYVFKTDTTDKGNRLVLPSTLKGVGNHAFDCVFKDMVDFEIPEGIEFIGMSAFRNNYYYSGDVDFPNLVVLGDYAFQNTATRNVYLHDKLKYMGVKVFTNCVYLNDLTFDLDVFDPSIYIAWAIPRRAAYVDYDSQFQLTTEFGPNSTSLELGMAKLKEYGVRIDEDRFNTYWPMKFGTIKFTDKNKHQLPSGYNNCYYSSSTPNAQAGGSCENGGYGHDQYNNFFGHLKADKIDIGETDWKVLSARMFVQVAADQVILPHNLEVIPGDSFSDAYIGEELILPNTVQVIGAAAFNYGSGSSLNNIPRDKTVKITKLPTSLVYVGTDAFYNDYNLTADLNSPNLKYVDFRAFMGTRIRDVYLPQTIKSLRAGAFIDIPTLRDITIDFDFGALTPNASNFDVNDMPQSFRDYAGDDVFQMLTMSSSAYRSVVDYSSNAKLKIVTFYNLFNHSLVADVKNGNTIVEFGQTKAKEHFGKVTFTNKAASEVVALNGRGNDLSAGFFSGMEFDEMDLSKTGWKQLIQGSAFTFAHSKIHVLKLPENLETTTIGSLEQAEIIEPFELPSTLKTIGVSSFQWTKGTYSNELPEGLQVIQFAGFYGADLTDNLVIPSTVTQIQPSAFNAGDEDVHYDTITIKPEVFTMTQTSGNLVHSTFWKNDVDKLIIDSRTLPAMVVGKTNGYQEFWHMPFDELILNNAEAISYKACEGCTNLKKVDLSKNNNITLINDYAFAGDTKLDEIYFSQGIKNKEVAIGQYAFENTAFETMGDAETDFDITAANFDATTGYAFYGMPKLRSVNIPNTFSHATVPAATFANDTDLETVSVDYRITDIKDDAFANDDKLARIFIWGNTVIEDTDLESYTAPDFYGHGGEPNANRQGDPALGLTIPETTDIYAYSVSPTEAYAGEPRDELEGTFYPLDEVLFVTTNNPKVEINEDNTDFDKTGIVTYAMRRDGIILQSDNWGEYNNNYYPRSTNNIVFEHQAEITAANPAFGTVYDTPVPLSALTVGNTNFEEIDFELIPDEEDDSIRLINVIYTDGYTRGKPDTDIDPYSEGNNDPSIPDPIEDIIEDLINGPITKDLGITLYAIAMAFTIAATILIVKKRYTR